MTAARARWLLQRPLVRQARRVLRNRIGLAGGLIIAAVAITALLAPLLAPYDPVHVDLEWKLLPPSAAHPMGTDQSGRDVLSRVIWGTRVSLQVAVLAVAIGLTGGVTGGCASWTGSPRSRCSSGPSRSLASSASGPSRLGHSCCRTRRR